MYSKRKKKIAKILSLVAAFLITLVITSFVTNHENTNLTEEMEDPVLPRVSFTVGNYTVNELPGYVDEMDILRMRDTMTPVTASSGVAMKIAANGQDIHDISYEIMTLDGSETLYKGNAEPAEEVTLAVGDTFRQVSEAVMKVTLSYGGSGSVNYYTRIADERELNTKQVLKFVNDFHTKTFDKAAAETELATYMESSADADNTSLQTVTIASSTEQLGWGSLEVAAPEKVSWEIKESNSSYTSVLLKYQVTCKGDTDVEDTYNVREFFRVRYTADRTYLLSYNRTMNQVFNPENDAFTKSAVQLGIIDPDVDYMTNKDGTIVAFVQERELWNFDEENKKISRAFSFSGDNGSDSRYNYDQHEVRIIAVDDDGSTTFMVCGYMNRDEHEGQVGAAVYRFDNTTNCVEEKAFIPSNKSYAVMADELGRLVYYNEEEDILYVMVNTTLYRINLADNRQEIFLDNMQDGEYVFADDGHVLAYQIEGDSAELAKSYKIVNLEEGTEYTLDADKNGFMKAIGFIGNDFIYGTADEGESGSSLLGEEVIPMESIRIIDSSQKLLKEYKQDGVYILDASVDANMITLHRAKKKGSNYISIDSDYITNNVEKDAGNITLTSFVTDKKQTQMRLTVADGIDDTNPHLLRPKQVIFSNPITLTLESKEQADAYYVYGNGELTGIYEKAGYAIMDADDCDGVVISGDQSYVWERGNRYLTKTLSDFPMRKKAEGESTLETCLQLVCEYEGNTANISNGKKQALSALSEGTGGTAMDLTGCTVEEMLYLISNDYPVILMLDASEAVVITGYDQTGTITYFDPEEGKTHTVDQEEFEALAEKSGNSFLSYFKNDNKKTEEK